MPKSQGQSSQHRELYDIIESPIKKGDHRMAEIIQATIKCINKIGIEHTSFEAVGQEAGLIKAHVNYYFKEKDDLIQAVLEYVLTKAQRMTVERLRNQTNPQLLLKTLNDVTFDWANENKEHLSVIVLLYYLCTVRPKLKAAHTKARLVARDRLVAILKEMGVKSAPKTLEAKAFAIHALTSGYLVEYATANSTKTLNSLKHNCYENIRLIALPR